MGLVGSSIWLPHVHVCHSLVLDRRMVLDVWCVTDQRERVRVTVTANGRRQTTTVSTRSSSEDDRSILVGHWPVSWQRRRLLQTTWSRQRAWRAGRCRLLVRVWRSSRHHPTWHGRWRLRANVRHQDHVEGRGAVHQCQHCRYTSQLSPKSACFYIDTPAGWM